MFDLAKVARSQQWVRDTNQLKKNNFTHARIFVKQVPITSSYNSLVIG